MTTTTIAPLTEAISMDDFAAIPTPSRGRRAISPQRLSVRNMDAGVALIFSHEGIQCGPKGLGGCSFGRMIALERKSSGNQYLYKHLADGRVAVARVST